MEKIAALECLKCGCGHSLSQVKYTCPACGGNLQLVYDYARIKRRLSRRSLREDPDRTIWRYHEILPVADRRHFPALALGWTPLYKARRLGRALGLDRLYIKDEGRNPSASFKDRASAVVLGRALESGERVLAAASTGNAASSLSCLAAGLGMRPVIFVPSSAPPAKLAQIMVFGSELVAVRGSYDEAFELCVRACEEYGWYNRNTGYNPFTREGKKTCAFELCEQLGWEVPDSIFVPVGDGNIISGLWKGFGDFQKLGLIDKMPKLVAVQAAGSDSIKRAFEGDGVLRKVGGRTIADSISVSLPRDGLAAVRALRESRGYAVSVSDQEILAAVLELARGAAVFAEPAAAAAYAGLKKAALAGRVRQKETAVVLVTGSGLKDAAAALKAAGRPHEIAPELRALRRLVASKKIDFKTHGGSHARHRRR